MLCTSSLEWQASGLEAHYHQERDCRWHVETKLLRIVCMITRNAIAFVAFYVVVLDAVYLQSCLGNVRLISCFPLQLAEGDCSLLNGGKASQIEK